MTAAPSPRARRTRASTVNTTPITTADAPARHLTEAQFQAQVAELATRLGWLVYHTHDSRRSNPGFPDLCMVRGNRVVFAELKTDRGRLRVDQARWLQALANAGQEVNLWRPRHWDWITRKLTANKRIRFVEEDEAYA